MKKTIIILTIIISINCNAQSIFDIFKNNPAHSTRLSSYFEFDDLYFYENSKGEKKYLNRKSSGFSFEPKRSFIDRCEININNWDFYLNNLNALDDQIEADSKSFELCLNSKYKDFNFDISAQYVKNKMKYDIDEFNGKIPISYFQSQLNLKYKNLKMELGSLSGEESDGNYDNNINGFSTGLSCNLTYKNLLFNAQGNYSNFSADLQKDNSIFCELNGFQLLQYSCSGRYYLHSHNSISSGIIGIATWQRERSFLDAEPFINYYSLFFGSKTFIKKMNFNAVLPYISYEQQFRYQMINFNAALNYYHLFTNSDIVYTERKWLIPGIWPDDSTKHSLELVPDIDGILRLNFHADVAYRNFIFGIVANQLLPVDYSKITKPVEPTPDKIKITEHGGTSITLTVGYLF